MNPGEITNKYPTIIIVVQIPEPPRCHPHLCSFGLVASIFDENPLCWEFVTKSSLNRILTSLLDEGEFI